jgi:hypothetical protein
MAELGEVTLETFAGHVGEPFRIRVPEADVAVGVTLGTAEQLSQDVGLGSRLPFSIIFYGPSDRILPQQIYSVEHEALGSYELFLVPLQPDDNGARYEAVFT